MAWRLTAAALCSVLLLTSARCARTSGNPEAVVERPPVAVEVTRVEAGDLEERIAVVGSLSPKFQGEVKAEYSGVIAEVLVSEWVRVKRGTLLARFDAREEQAAVKGARATRMQAEAGAVRAKRELERYEKLRAAGLATQQTLDDARSAHEAAVAQLDAAAAQEEMARTRLAKTDILAPMDGVVASRTVNPGDFVENMGGPRPMFTIVDNRKLELTVSVPSTRIGSVALGQPLSFTVDSIPGRTFGGKVSFINPAVDEASRTVRVVAVVENADGALKSGLFARGEIVTGRRAGVLRVPRTALLTWDPLEHRGAVYVVDGGRARRREVSTGGTSGDDVEISAGLSAGEIVVTRGGFDVREGDRVSEKQKAESRKQEWEGGRFLPSAFCLLPSAVGA